MVNFELAKEAEKDVFRLVSSVGQRKKFWVPLRNQTSGPRIPRFDALPLSHRDSTVSEVYYEVHMARFLHTSRMNNVDSVIFVGQIVDQIALSNCYFAYTFYSVEVITTKLMIR